MYQLGFTPPTGQMCGEVRLPLDQFRANFRGQPVRDAPPIRGEDIVQVGFMLSRFDSGGGGVDGAVQNGAFRLGIESLEGAQ